MRRSERGQILVLMVLMMLALLGAAGLAIDGVRQYADRRSTQGAADSAAMAAALALCNDEDVSSAALASAAVNGFDNDGDTNTVTVNHPPADGYYAGDDEYIEVIINSEQKASFAQVVFSGDLESTSRAVARCFGGVGSGPVGGGSGLIALNPNSNQAVYVTGSGCLKVNGGGIFVNSSHASSFYVDGGSTCSGAMSGQPRVNADWIQVVGSYYVPGWVVINPNPPTTGVAAVADPLPDLQPPAMPGYAAAPTMPGCTASFITGVYNNGNLNMGNHWCTAQPHIKPGRYNSFSVSSDANVIMDPGLYYISGGNFSISGAARVQANGVMIYVTAGSVRVGASGNVTITAATEGDYAGLAIYMDRTNTSNFTIDGAGATLLRGTIYAPGATVVAGGSATNNTLNAQILAGRYRIEGAAVFNVLYDADVVYSGGGDAGVVELVQ